MNDIILPSHVGKKSKKNRKNSKPNVVTPEEVKSHTSKEVETEDLAESVDSGCIPDSSSDIVADLTDSSQIEAAVFKENLFISNLLRWLPLPLQSKEPEVDTREGKKRKFKEDSKEDGTEPSSKKQKVDADQTKIYADLDELQEKYRKTLSDLRKNRNKKWDPATRKKEAKLAKKLKVLEKRKDKRSKKKVKFPDRIETRKETNVAPQKNLKNVKPQKPIYNKKGELVFSKFDFSNTSSLSDTDGNVKSKDLKQILSQALKEKEQMKHLEKKGDKEGAISIAEQKAWANALQKAEGKKVKSDVEMLKKSIKKRETRKKMSQKKWEQRKETIQKHKADKQNARKKNITARKDAKLDKKMKKMKKKGHVVPGF